MHSWGIPELYTQQPCNEYETRNNVNLTEYEKEIHADNCDKNV